MKKSNRVLKAMALSSAIVMGVTSLYISPIVTYAKANEPERELGVVLPKRELPFDIPEYHEVAPKSRLGLRAAAHTPEVTLPASYSSVERNLVGPVQNQNRTGTCWAFATIAALESSAIKSKVKVGGEVATKDNLNLSERHLAYFARHNVTDKLGGLAGDVTTFAADSNSNYLNTGNWALEGIFTLANWKGAVSEADAPFAPVGALNDAQVADNNCVAQYVLPDSMSYNNNSVLIKDAYVINYTRPDLIKREVMDHGAAIMEFCIDQSTGANYETDALYNDSDIYANHDVCIVGWDDNYSKDNFLSSKKPDHDGAWLIKNSYGSNYKHGGFFWVSYDDKSLAPGYGNGTTHGNGAYILTAQDTDTYDNNYQYDGTTNIELDDIASGGYIANRFTVPKDAQKQTLNAVSFAVQNTNVEYGIQIYKGGQVSDPTSGQPQLLKEQTGDLKYTGYYTINLDQGVVLQPGDTFSVVIKLKDRESNGYVNYFVDKTGSWGSDEYINEMQRGQSYKKFSASAEWEDCYDSSFPCTPRIKAFTVNRVGKIGDLNADNEYTTSDLDVMSTLIQKYQAASEDEKTSIFAKIADLDNDKDIDNDDLEILKMLERDNGYKFLGDHNGDHVYTGQDASTQFGYIRIYGIGKENGSTETYPEYDLDGDGDVDAYDYEVLSPKLRLGDVNYDGKIDNLDKNTMVNEIRGYSMAVSEGTYYYNYRADMDLDGDIDYSDFELLLVKLEVEANTNN